VAGIGFARRMPPVPIRRVFKKLVLVVAELLAGRLLMDLCGMTGLFELVQAVAVPVALERTIAVSITCLY